MEVFHSIERGMKPWAGLLVYLLLAFLIISMMAPLMQEMARSSMLESGQVALEDVDAMMSSPVMVFSLKVAPTLGFLFNLLVMAFFLWLAFLVFFGAVPFGRIFTLALYAGFVDLLLGLLNNVYLATTSPEISSHLDLAAVSLNLSLGAFFDPLSFPGAFLSRFGLFQVWKIWLLVAGSSVVLDRERSKTLWPVLMIAILGALFAAFTSTLAGKFGAMG
jgi:hypothetical protein